MILSLFVIYVLYEIASPSGSSCCRLAISEVVPVYLHYVQHFISSQMASLQHEPASNLQEAVKMRKYPRSLQVAKNPPVAQIRGSKYGQISLTSLMAAIGNSMFLFIEYMIVVEKSNIFIKSFVMPLSSMTTEYRINFIFIFRSVKQQYL